MLRLDQQLCFLLYSASRKMTAAYRPFLIKIGLTYPQYLVMMVLWEYFGITKGVDSGTKTQGMTVGDLGEKLELDSGTLTPLLKRLEKNHLVIRQRDEEDERVVRILLTKEGVELNQNAMSVAFHMRCSSGLTDESLTEVREGVRELLSQIPIFKP